MADVHDKAIRSFNMSRIRGSDTKPEILVRKYLYSNGIRYKLNNKDLPGKPMQNGYVERFNRLYREAILDAYLFFDLDQVRQLTQEWMEEYNERKPHEGLNNLTPEEWKNKIQKNQYLQLSTVLFMGYLQTFA